MRLRSARACSRASSTPSSSVVPMVDHTCLCVYGSRAWQVKTIGPRSGTRR
jgi:hypothetical protein